MHGYARFFLAPNGTKMNFRAARTEKNGKTSWFVDLRRVNGGRKFFKTRDEAATFAEAKSIESSQHGAAAFLLSAEQRLAFMAAEKKLNAVGATIGQAVEFYIANAKARLPRTIAAAIDEFECAKVAAGRASRYVNQLRYTLDAFAETVGPESLCHEIGVPKIETWLNSNGFAARTRKGYLIDLATFFGFCVKRGYATSNPATVVEKIIVPRKPPGILTVEQCADLMEAGRKVHPSMLPFLTLGLFCGLRPAEILRLNNGNLTREFVRVDADKAKTKQRRIVDIAPNARRWLKLGGEIPPVNWKKRLLAIRTKARIPWPHDCLRHSFCSYHLAFHESAEKTALQAGHSSQILFEHYRELVTRSDAKAFWGIRP